MKVAERFFCPEEYLALQKGKMKKADCYFTELWTRKESYIKAVGKGMALDLASFCVLQDQVKFLKAGQTGEWYLQSYDPASGYILSVCAKNVQNARFNGSVKRCLHRNLFDGKLERIYNNR